MDKAQNYQTSKTLAINTFLQHFLLRLIPPIKIKVKFIRSRNKKNWIPSRAGMDGKATNTKKWQWLSWIYGRENCLSSSWEHWKVVHLPLEHHRRHVGKPSTNFFAILKLKKKNYCRNNQVENGKTPEEN